MINRKMSKSQDGVSRATDGGLDNNANNPHQYSSKEPENPFLVIARNRALEKITETDEKYRRQKDYKNLDFIQKNQLSTKRVCSCGTTLGKYLEIWENKHGSDSFAKMETCGSVHSCPICRRKIKQKHREELRMVMDYLLDANRNIYMLTLTCKHEIRDEFKDLVGSGRSPGKVAKGFLGAWGELINSKGWKKFKKINGVIGQIRATETTYSLKSGYHYHAHVLIISDKEIKDLEETKKGIFKEWSRLSVKCGLRKPSILAMDLQGAEYASDYVSKWGADSEMTGSKKGIGSGYSIYELEDMLTSEYLLGESGFTLDRVKAIIKEMSRVLKGTKSLTWPTRGELATIRKAVTGSEKSDEDLAKLDYDDVVELKALVERPLANEFKRLGIMGYVKTMSENGMLRDFVDGFLREEFSEYLITDPVILKKYQEDTERIKDKYKAA
jgi:hypothetical protein